MKVHGEVQNTWHVKVIWKIQYKLADARINLNVVLVQIHTSLNFEYFMS